MFGLAAFSSVPFASFLRFSYTNPVTGLQANALLGSVVADPTQIVSITGLGATAILNIGTGTGGVAFPNTWTSIITDQYRSS